MLWVSIGHAERTLKFLLSFGWKRARVAMTRRLDTRVILFITMHWRLSMKDIKTVLDICQFLH